MSSNLNAFIQSKLPKLSSWLTPHAEHACRLRLSRHTATCAKLTSTQEDGQQHDRQNNRQHEQKAARLAPRVALISRSRPQLPIRRMRVLVRPLHIIRNARQLLALLRDDLRDLLEEHIQIPYTLLNVPDLLLALSDQGILEIDLVLRGQPEFLLELLLLLLLRRRGERGAFFFISSCGTRGRDGGPLFFECLALKGLELVEGLLKFAEELLLFVFLRRL